MRYDAVVLYADEHCGSFPRFRLPAHSLTNPAGAKSVNQKCKEYVRTDPESWNLLKDGIIGRTIDPFSYLC